MPELKMRSACILILATVCCMSGVLTKPQARDYVTLEGHGVCVRAQHQSGKFRIAAEGQCTYDKDRTGQISVELEEIAEVNSKGQAVGTSGKVKHYYNSFAKQNFELSDVTSGTVQGLSVDYFHVSNQLDNFPATLTFRIYLIKDFGNVTTQGESLYTAPGFIKFSIELSNWKWCGNTPSDDSCGKKNKQETGQFVDLTISVKGDSVAQEEPTDDNNGFAYSLGGETDIQFSQMVSRDGVLETMADGYPKYTRQGGKDLFTIRFNRFSTVTSFDAIIGTSSIVDDKIRQSHESEENKSN